VTAKSNKFKILRTDAELFIIEQYLKELSELAQVTTTERTDEAGLAEAARDADLILTCYINITAKVIESAGNLKAIVKYGVGTDNIDIAAASRRGVMVVNCPDYGTESVADHAFALMIALARRIPEIDRAMRQHAWIWPAPEWFGVDIAGKILGLVGLGRIGRAMARRAKGFGMKVLVADPYIDRKVAASLGIALIGLDELLSRADFVSIHCVRTPETRGLIGEKAIARMKRTAYLIDVARGAIVDEDALIRALDAKRIAGCALDVFAEEPLGVDYPLLGRDNVILTPHFAWYTKEAFERCERDTFARIRDILEGRRPKNLKNAEAFR
jgi:D-3-phosphoglycerate dehydrogenase